jgi:hypothetical protein
MRLMLRHCLDCVSLDFARQGRAMMEPKALEKNFPGGITSDGFTHRWMGMSILLKTRTVP